MKTLVKERQRKAFEDSPLLCPPEMVDLNPSVPRGVALIDSQGNVVAVNEDWGVFAKKTGAVPERVGPGVNYLEACRKVRLSPAASRKALGGIESVLKGKSPFFSMDYSLHTPSGLAHFRMNANRIDYGDVCVAISHINISDLKLSKQEEFKRIRQFARRLINAQEDERQRISRELHDDLGHRIALMSFSVRHIIKQHSKSSAATRDLNKILDGISDFSTALRNLSHSFYPPHLRYLGIRSAVKALGEEFEEAYGIHVDLELPEETPRRGNEVELCVFRVLQESLQNIAKHSGATKVRIVLEYEAEEIRLMVVDTGRGFDRSTVTKSGGLGLLSMEERALSIGACLTVNSSLGVGTEICLSVPLADQAIGYA